MKHVLFIVGGMLVTVFMLLAGSASAAGENRSAAEATEMLKRVDAAVSRYQTLVARYEVLDLEPGMMPRHLDFRVKRWGERQRIDLLGPKDAKGTSAVMLPGARLYVYLPQFRKIRRVINRLDARSILGTAIAYSQLSFGAYGRRYRASEVVSIDGGHRLMLDARSGKGAGYAQLALEIDARRGLPTRIQFFDERGELLKTQYRRNYRCKGGLCVAADIEMVDHSVGGHRTRLTLRELSVDVPLDRKLFTKRGLIR